MLQTDSLFKEESRTLISIKEASKIASSYLNRKVSPSNIMYLLNYGRINRYGTEKTPLLDLNELKQYYERLSENKAKAFKEKAGEDLHWHLSFDKYSEFERTKHVHRIHPYKGKFIPQLVEYFLDTHIDEFKKEIYFRPGDIVLDPFCGSGTTLVQANELALNSIGIDISEFNVLISEVKVAKHKLSFLIQESKRLTEELHEFKVKNLLVYQEFEEELNQLLNSFNNEFFPSPDYKKKISRNIINEKEYSKEKELSFLEIYKELVKKFSVQLASNDPKSFIDKWFLLPVKQELRFLSNKIKQIDIPDTRNILRIILSRTARSCRATTHADLATLKDPVIAPYYCKKHGKICKPLFSIIKWWNYYCRDTINRLIQFDKLRTNAEYACLIGDSRTIDIISQIERYNPSFAKLIKEKGITGIFSSPPYVGLIDYHEQHAYAYELFDLTRRDELEISPMSKGQGKLQQMEYVKSISQVLLNCKKYMAKDYNVFLVANDKFNLYPKIAELSGMKIVHQFKRPVLCRVEKDRETPYHETIFHLKEKS